MRASKRRGKVGLVLTKMDMGSDLSVVTVEMALWVRQGPGRWTVSGSRSARVRPDDLGPEAGKDLAEDPQVAMAFKVVESLGLGEIDPALKKRSLAVGAATRKALGQARTAAMADLAALALPILEPAPKP